MDYLLKPVDYIYGIYSLHTPTWRPSQLLLFDESKLHYPPIIACILYILMLLLFPKIQVAWNFGLSIYSGFTFLYVTVMLIWLISRKNYTIWTVVCDGDCRYFDDGPIMLVPGLPFWGSIFCWSKIAEMGDTFFLILKKPERPLKFLHWYHHLTVLILAWYSCSTHFSIGVFCMFMNSGVHTFMYFYYGLTGFGFRPPFGFALTIVQTLQMVFGVTVSIMYVLGRIFSEKPCCCKNIKVMFPLCAIIYGSYLYLFVMFFLEKYYPKKKKE